MENIRRIFRDIQKAWSLLRRQASGNTLPASHFQTLRFFIREKFSQKNQGFLLSGTPRTMAPPQQLSSSKGHGFWKWTLRILLGIGLTGLLTVIGVFAYFAKDLPSPGEVNSRVVAESTKIFDRTGNHTLYEIHGEEKRTLIPFSDMPEAVRAATITLEDQDFYSHHGIKFTSIVRAVMKDVLHRGAAQGGSTITQQFVKNSLLTSEKTLTRKIKEVILSLEMEQKFSKDEILAMYLNEIPYGSNAYGIEAAAETFFGKHAKDLTLDESAFLASLPQAPTFYSPYGSHLDELKWRQNHTLSQMATLGYISNDQAEEAKKIDTLEKLTPQREAISAPHFVMYVKEYLAKRYGDEALEQGGLKVYTTLDWEKQQAAEKAVQEGAEKNAKYKAENAALVAIDPKTGQILAMVGSKNYFDTKIDGQVNVAIRPRQPGSSFKPYVYLNAFTLGYVPETVLYDVPTNFETEDGKTYEPQNYDGSFHGPIELKRALGGSLNIPAVKTLYLAGVKRSVELATALGITTLTDPNRYGLSLVLGGGEVLLVDHVNAYATLATGGVKHEKTALLKVEDAKGEVLEEYKDSPGERIVDEKYVAMLDSVLSNNDNRAWVFGENSPLRFNNRPVVAKTGTTNEWRDAWTIGYTPSIAVGVWAGNNDNSPLTKGADGVYVAAPIWRAFMDEALQNTAIEDFPKYNPDDEIAPRDKDGLVKSDENKNAETAIATDSPTTIPSADSKANESPFMAKSYPIIIKPLLGGWVEKNDDVKVCEIPGKKGGYCLANKYCPNDDVKKKDFVNPHSILYYVNPKDPRGPIPEHPSDDPQYKNWEKDVKEWYKNEKKLVLDAPPEDECKEDDFKDKYGPKVSLSAPDETSDSSFAVSAKADAPYGVGTLELFVDGSSIGATESSSLSVSYSIPDGKRGSTLSVEARLKDDNGNETKTSKSVKTTAPPATP